MMRIIPAAGTVDAFSGAQHGAVYVDRQFSGAQQLDLMGNNVGVEGFQGVETLVGKPSQKRAHAAGSRQIRQTAEPLQQGISFQEIQMSQPTPAYPQQTQQNTGKAHHTEVAAKDHTAQVTAQLPVPIDGSQIPHQQFQTRIRGEAFTGEFDLQFVVDTRVQIGFLSSHCTWPFVLGELGVSSLPNIPKWKAFSY